MCPAEDDAGNHDEPTRDLDGRHPLAEEGNGKEDAQERLELPEDSRPRRPHPVDGGEVEQVRDNASQDDRIGEPQPARLTRPKSWPTSEGSDTGSRKRLPTTISKARMRQAL